MATEHRPAVIPARTGQTTTVPPTARKPLPAGAVAWSQTYVDAQGLPQKSDFPVPVDGEGRRTDHIRHTCRGHIEIDGVKQPCDQVAWLLPADPARGCPDHIVKLEPAEKTGRDPLLPWQAIGRAVGPAARPWWVIAVNAAAGIGAYAGGVPWWSVAAATPLLAAGAWRGCRDYLTRAAVKRRSIEAGETEGRRVDTIAARARAAGYMTAGSGTWITAAASTGQLAGLLDVPPADVAAVMAALLAGGWAAGSATWWNHLERLRNRPEPAAPETPTAVAAGPDPAAAKDAADWAADVATGEGLAHTTVDLATWKADVGGRRMVIRARKGALTEERLQRAVPLIAAAFNVPIGSIGWVPQYEGSPRSALLLVQPNSPLNDPVAWDPVDVVPVGEAVAHIGTRIDGSRLVTRLWTPGWGAPSRLILGTKGSGKTEYLRLLLLAMLKARVQGPDGPVRLVAPFLHDPKRGKDFGAFRRQVSGFSTTNDCLSMIVEALVREMDRRYDALGSDVWFDDLGRPREGETAFDPSVHGPIISLVIDELHEPAKFKPFIDASEPMARKMRAGGIEIVGATHKSTLDDTGSQGFRDMLAGGETTLFRTTLGLNAALATGGQLVGDPRALPRVPGMNLHASGEEDTMQARMAFVPSDELYNMLYDERNVSRIQPVSWPAETLEAFGPDFCEWMRACQARQPGDPAPPTPKAHIDLGRRQSVPAGDLDAAEALRQILFAAAKPVGRDDIVASPLWAGRSATSTLTGALRTGQDAGWIVKQGVARSTTFELSPVERERMQVGADEMAEAR